MNDDRAATEYRIPAKSLRKGDLINTDQSEQDWQEVLGVYTKVGQAQSEELREVVKLTGGRYVVVELTDLTPIDSGVFYVDRVPTAIEDDHEAPLSEIVSDGEGSRVYLYTKYELVTIRGN
jgi:hypothetical protein